MAIIRDDIVQVRTENDVVVARQTVRRWAADLGLGIVDQTKIVTAASELARNTLSYGGGGTMRLEAVSEGTRKGLRLTFEDRGPGIANLDLALQDGYTTGGGLGLGLGGSRRLVSEFDIRSVVGEGTRVTIARWK
jgi:serine/threonine-protein kinase RsbT